MTGAPVLTAAVLDGLQAHCADPHLGGYVRVSPEVLAALVGVARASLVAAQHFAPPHNAALLPPPGVYRVGRELRSYPGGQALPPQQQQLYRPALDSFPTRADLELQAQVRKGWQQGTLPHRVYRGPNGQLYNALDMRALPPLQQSWWRDCVSVFPTLPQLRAGLGLTYPGDPRAQ